MEALTRLHELTDWFEFYTVCSTFRQILDDVAGIVLPVCRFHSESFLIALLISLWLKD